MEYEICPSAIMRKQRQARIWVAMAAILSSTCVLTMTVLMVTGQSAIA